MPDKLTDKEIVKALPFLAKYCKNEYNDIRVDEVLLGAFNLINRLQAENKSQSIMIKMLNGSIEDYKNSYINQKAEIERLKDYATIVEKEVDWHKDELRHSDKKVSTKAYKEVFQKLNDKALVRKIKLFGGWFIVKGVTLHDINKLKKELVGEDNAEEKE